MITSGAEIRRRGNPLMTGKGALKLIIRTKANFALLSVFELLVVGCDNSSPAQRFVRPEMVWVGAVYSV